jgi:trans-aconitate methyltransferase
LSTLVGHQGRVTAIDLQTEFLSHLRGPNITAQRHDVRTDSMPDGGPFDLIHLRAVLMHLEHRMEILRRAVSWLAPGGWLPVEEPDFGMGQNEADPVWAAHPRAWHEAFPHGSLFQGRLLLRQIHNLGLVDVDADAELDIVRANTPLAEFYRLSMAALAGPSAATSALTPEEAAALVESPTDSHFRGGSGRFGDWRGDA